MALPKNIRGSRLSAPRKLASNPNVDVPAKASGTSSQSRSGSFEGSAAANMGKVQTPVKSKGKSSQSMG